MSKLNTHKLAAAVTVGLMVGASDVAVANQNMKNVSDNLVASSQTLPNLISVVAYVAGLAMAVFGIMKIKEHVDNPAQVKLKDGLIRLGVGGALLALPFILNVATNSLSNGQAGTITAANLQFQAATFK
jgi:ABC-type spermidine/putrescine transport system permease subunit II